MRLDELKQVEDRVVHGEVRKSQPVFRNLFRRREPWRCEKKPLFPVFAGEHQLAAEQSLRRQMAEEKQGAWVGLQHLVVHHPPRAFELENLVEMPTDQNVRADLGHGRAETREPEFRVPGNEKRESFHKALVVHSRSATLGSGVHSGAGVFHVTRNTS